jgi:rhodanese-related sulfurtransferase
MAKSRSWSSKRAKTRRAAQAAARRSAQRRRFALIGAVVGVLVVAGLVAFWPSSSDSPEVGESSDLISVQDAEALIESRAGDPSFVIVDVRTPEEFAQGHIEDAVNIDVEGASFASTIADLDPGVTYLVYCRTGNRSAAAVSQMRAAGLTDVTDVDGGIVSWTEAGLPLV